MVPSSRENKPDHEGFMNIVPNTPVEIVFADFGSVETPSRLWDTIFISISNQKEKTKKIKPKSEEAKGDIFSWWWKYSPSLVTVLKTDGISSYT